MISALPALQAARQLPSVSPGDFISLRYAASFQFVKFIIEYADIKCLEKKAVVFSASLSPRDGVPEHARRPDLRFVKCRHEPVVVAVASPADCPHFRSGTDLLDYVGSFRCNRVTLSDIHDMPGVNQKVACIFTPQVQKSPDQTKGAVNQQEGSIARIDIHRGLIRDALTGQTI